MSKILLGVTGSVAASRTPDLYKALKEADHQVRVLATPASLYFFDPVALDPGRSARNPEIVSLDEDEWPGRAQGRRWQRDDPVLHIELRRWADLLLLAPLDANTLAKLAHGLADNCLTCVWRAWDPERPIVLAPAMNTLMWKHKLTEQHFLMLAGHAGISADTEGPSGDWVVPDSAVEWVNNNCPQLCVVPPASKQLACGDFGVGAMAELDEIVDAVEEMLE
jgi:phosphopantothenoylcysteine decarboxylase